MGFPFAASKVAGIKEAFGPLQQNLLSMLEESKKMQSDIQSQESADAKSLKFSDLDKIKPDLTQLS